jgi:cytoskeletal protein CcmA (bactofilin family)
MGIASFSWGRGEGEGGRNSSASEPGTSAVTGALTAFICEGAEFKGKLRSKDTVRLDGRFSGSVLCDNAIVVGEAGEVEANLDSKNVIISGSVAGDVIARRQLILKSSARLKGNIDTPSLIIEPGARFNGQVNMVRPEVTANAAAAEAKPAQPVAAASNERRPAKEGVARPAKPWPASIGSSTASS